MQPVQPESPRILLITPTPPWPTSSGANQRTNLLWNALRKIGTTDVLFVDEFDNFEAQALARLERAFAMVGYVAPRRRGAFLPWRLVRPLAPMQVDRLAFTLGRRRVRYEADPNVASWLKERLKTQRYDLIVVRYLGPAGMAGIPSDIPVIVDVDDLDTEVARNKLHLPNLPTWQRLIFGWQAWQIERIVPPLLTRFRHLFVTNDADAARMAGHSTSVLPNIPFGAYTGPLAPRHDSKVLLVVGSLYYRPNVEGVDHFVNAIWPAVRKAHPDARFRIVGGGMPEESKRAWAAVEGVEPIGFVDDVAEHYGACAFSVAPIFRGGGTKIKVLESLLLGRTCVTSTHALGGYEQVLRDGESLRSAGTDAEFSERCIRLLADPNERERLAQRGHDVVRDQFNAERFQKIVKDAVVKVIG